MKKFQVVFHTSDVDLTRQRARPSRAEFDTVRAAVKYSAGRGYIYRVQQAESGAWIYTRRVKLR